VNDYMSEPFRGYPQVNHKFSTIVGPY